MGSFARTAAWVVGAAVALFVVLSGLGYFFLTSHSNRHAETILEHHSGAILSLYVRLGVGYIAAGFLAAVLLHPFVRGWKAALGALGLAMLGLVFTLTNRTQLVYGPVQSLYCSIHDAIPAWIRGPYRPWMILVLFGALAV
ncbi:MAG: hypothetical protein OER88_03680, partial [Planctomycetota bacterium]|nr:hypothetical protein [Planctomycetota bacterium]